VGVASAESRLDLGGWLVTDDEKDEDIPVFVSLIDFESEQWVPGTIEGSLDAGEAGVVISEKAADDLGVGAGEVVVLRHPRREGLGYSFVESELPVTAVHPNPYRFMLYMDHGHADLFALDGIVNTLSVNHDDTVSRDELKRALFGEPGVAAVQGVNESAETLRELIDESLGFLTVVQGAVLLLALLIAFNSTSISADERAREHATMFSFGLPTRTVMALTIAESLVIGVLGTAIGIVFGRVLLAWLVRVLLPTTVPDLYIQIDVASSTYLTAALLGVVAVGLAPLLTYRRLRRMDIPSTLRVVE
jgi:putative ABC transport system permease protein